jgi:hypothetical protein
MTLSSYSEADLHRWLHLRAIEWAGWPAFVSQPIIPVLLIFYPWAWVLLVLLCAELVWSFFGYSVVSVSLSSLSARFVIIFKWPGALVSSIVLFTQGRYALAAVSLLWPLLAGFIPGPSGGCLAGPGRSAK